MDCNFLTKSYLHFNVEGMKFWMTDLLSHVKLYHCSITKASFAESQPMFPTGTFRPLWRASWPPSHENHTSRQASHTHDLPSLATMTLGIFKVNPASTWQPTSVELFTVFTVPYGRPVTMTSGADGVSHWRGQSALVQRASYDILRVESHSGHWHLSFRCLLLHVWIE